MSRYAKYISLALICCGSLAWSLAADEKTEDEVASLLARPISFHVRAESLQAAVERLAKEVNASLPQGSDFQLEIKLLGKDLQREGITRNQRINNLQIRERPFRKVLTALVQRATGNAALKDPADAGQKVVWVVARDSDSGKKRSILITTREMAKQRSYKLPVEFKPKAPAP